MKDTAMLDQMYEMNVVYFKELSMYIIAGKRKLEEVRGGELAELMAKAQVLLCRKTHRLQTTWLISAIASRKKSTIWN